MKPTNEKLAADILSAGKKEFLEKDSRKRLCVVLHHRLR